MKSKLKKQIIMCMMVGTLSVTSLIPLTAVQAEELKGTEKVEKTADKKDIDKSDKEIAVEPDQGDSEDVKSKSFQKDIVQKRIDLLNLDKEMLILTQELERLNEGLKKEKKLVAKTAELKAKEASLDERWEGFSKRLAIWQVEGTPEENYIDVLLGSENFSDLVSKTFAYQTLLKADKEMVLLLQDEKAKLLKDKEVLETELKLLKEQKTDSLKKEKELAEKKTTMEEELKQLEEKEVERIKEEIRKQEERKRLLLEKQLLAEKIEKENALKESLANEEAIEELRMLSAELGIEYESEFIRPTKGRLTSKFGLRSNPFNGKGFEFHQGIDIANPIGTPISATADGVVVKALASGSGYGHYITLQHDIDGTTFYSVYAHLSVIGVEVGEQVKQGEMIGLMGSTGRSTGPHLHFEIQDAKKVAMNPESVLDKMDKAVPVKEKEKEASVDEKADKDADKKPDKKEVKKEDKK